MNSATEILNNLPLAWASPITAMLFVLLLFLIWRFSSASIFADAPDKALWRDYRIWGTALILIQLGIYALFS
jgi:hypothetical protein